MHRFSFCTGFILLSAFSAAWAQAPVDYRDVGVVVNDNDTNSVAIAAYFAAKRGVPERNIIHIRTSRSETINDSTFEDLRRQVENYLTSTGLKDSLNYLVLTKGVPHRVDRGGTGGDVNSRSASVDSELMLILGQWSSHIGQATLIIPPSSVRVHPYFARNEPYARRNIIPGSSSMYDMYLVTRLDGLTKEDVFALIDRSGPFTLVNKDSALFVLDMDPTPISATYNDNMPVAADILVQRGWRILLNRDSVYVTDQRNVIGYTSWGSNDHYDHHYTQYARPRNHWTAGSVAETYVSTSARNFTPGATSGQSRIADLIAEGCTGASGYVFEPFTVALSWVNILFERYTNGYNLAESYYMSMPTMSWMAVVVGDPKTSIITAVPPRPSPTIDPVQALCAGDAATLRARGALRGNMSWFAGDTNTVHRAGPPYDARHPLWVGRDSVLARVMPDTGVFMFSFFNENFVGGGWAQVRVIVLPRPKAGFAASADTVYLDRDSSVLFTDTSRYASTRTWDFGDGTTGGDESTVRHTFTRAGTFTVQLEVSNGACTDVARKTIRVEERFPTALETLAARPHSPIVSATPNPAASRATLVYTLPVPALVSIAVFDRLGRNVMVFDEGKKSEGTHRFVLETQKLPPGVYFIRLDAGNGIAGTSLAIVR
ncbi:MAG: TIGR03790 family protein [Bacteroidota bacterium]|nr:TIGR03790 family protein [Bacteroidota bacterium]